ncbi:MAG: hypothetical protein WAS05_00145 [Candidatus Nanopelagicales bacterium]
MNQNQYATRSDLDDCLFCENNPKEAGDICTKCLIKVSQFLTDIDEAWELSATPNTPTPGSGDGNRGSKDPQLPGGDLWLEWRFGTYIAKLDDIVDDWTYKIGATRPGSDLHDIVVWLRQNLNSAATNEHINMLDAWAKIREVRSAGKAALRMFDSRKRAACPNEITADGELCQHPLRFNPNVLDDHVYCSKCGHDWLIGRLLMRLSMYPNVRVDIETASMCLGVSRSTLQRLARKHPEVRRNAMYDLAACRELREAS